MVFFNVHRSITMKFTQWSLSTLEVYMGVFIQHLLSLTHALMKAIVKNKHIFSIPKNVKQLLKLYD